MRCPFFRVMDFRRDRDRNIRRAPASQACRHRYVLFAADRNDTGNPCGSSKCIRSINRLLYADSKLDVKVPLTDLQHQYDAGVTCESAPVMSLTRLHQSF